MKWRIFTLVFFILGLSLAGMAHGRNAKMSYPQTRTERVVDVLHGVEVVDPYRWLEDAENAEVREWVEKQNSFTKSVLDPLPGRAQIRERLNSLLDIGTLGTPTPAKGAYFYTKREGKQNQAILYVREGLKGKDRVLVDPNTMARDGTVALDWWYPSREGRYLAYGLSKNGSEQSTLRVRDVKSGADLPDTIERTRYCSLAWLPDSKGFYYTRYPAIGSVAKGEENYHHHVYFHALGTDPGKDQKVFGQGRPAEDMPTVALSPDGRWLCVTEHKGWAKTEVYFKDVSQEGSSFKPLVERVKAVFDVTVRNDHLYVRTNESAPRYKVYRVDPLKPARKDWVEILPEGEDVLDGLAAVGDTLAGLYMHQASSRLRLFNRNGKAVKEIELPTLGTIAALGGEWDGTELFFGFQSFTVPSSVYRMDLSPKIQSSFIDKTANTILFAEKYSVCNFFNPDPRVLGVRVPGSTWSPSGTDSSNWVRTDELVELWDCIRTDVDFSRYEIEQVRYPSKDGTEITMFLAHKKGIQRNGQVPTLLYGYGGFNISLSPTFNPSRFLFLEQGGLMAIPNLRGGGEYGESWHEAGMLAKKQNVFDDFLAAAEWLIERKYTDHNHLVIQGGSNGGLLVGAALTQRPDLFRAVVCQVPLLDMIRYHKFLIARLWIPEYGSADNADQFKWLMGYSPYQNVKEGVAYPAVLLEAAESDGRVDALHARKMVARLQAATSSDQPVLLRLETKAGHGQGKPRAKVLDELTDTWSFVFWQLGIGG